MCLLAQSLMSYGLLFQHLQLLSHLSGAPGDARGKAAASEFSSSGLGDPRAAHTARATVQSISSAKLEGYHLQSPDVFITPVGKVNLPHREGFFFSLGFLWPARAEEQGTGSNGHSGGQQHHGPWGVSSHQGACIACFDISSCQTINRGVIGCNCCSRV